MTDTSKFPSRSGGTVEFGREVDAARTRGAVLVPPLDAYTAWASDVAEAVLDALPAATLRWQERADEWTFIVHVHGDPVVSFDSDTGWYEGDGTIWSGVIGGTPSEIGRVVAANYIQRRA